MRYRTAAINKNRNAEKIFFLAAIFALFPLSKKVGSEKRRIWSGFTKNTPAPEHSVHGLGSFIFGGRGRYPKPWHLGQTVIWFKILS